MVDRTRHICEQVRVPVGVARDECPELYPLRDLSHRPEERPALEVLAFGIAVERVEVVPGENRISPHLLYPEPRVAHLRVTGVLRLELHPDPYRHTSPPLLANREIMSRGGRDQMGYNSARAAVMTPRVPVRITSPRVSARNALSETRVRSAVPSAFPAMAAGMSKSPRGTSQASTRPRKTRTTNPMRLMGKKYNALVPLNSCFGRSREARSNTIGGPASPVEGGSAPLAAPATRGPHPGPAPGSLMSLTRSRAEKMTITPTPRRT